MSSKSVIRSKLKKCQLQFNEAWERNLMACMRRLQIHRDDLLLELLGLTDDWSQLNRLYNIYFDLMLNARREGNETELDYYKSKVEEVKNALRSNKIIRR